MTPVLGVSQCHSGSRLQLWPVRFENESTTTEAAMFRTNVTRLDWVGAICCVRVYRRLFRSLLHLSRHATCSYVIASENASSYT